MVTVQEILRLPKMRELKVIAGQNGLDRRVNYVTVMEVPDITRWLKGDDFLITSLYSVRDSVSSQCRLLEELSQAACSCVAIKTGQYVKKVEKPLCDTADRLGLPLIRIPYQVSYIDIILNIMTLILEENNTDAVLEKYIRDVVFDVYDDPSLMLERGSMIGLNPSGGCYLFLTFRFDRDEENAQKGLDPLRSAAHAVAQFAAQQSSGFYHPVVSFDENVSVVLAAETAARLKEMLPYIQNEAVGQARYYSPNRKVKIGIGTIESGLHGIRDSYRNSVRAIRTGEIFKPERQVCSYPELRIYCLLNNALSANSDEIVRECLGKIDNAEILDTLNMYYECNANVEKTAQSLFVHKNTIKYRLQRVQELTGLDVRNHDENFRLYLAVLARKIQKNSQNV